MSEAYHPEFVQPREQQVAPWAQTHPVALQQRSQESWHA